MPTAQWKATSQVPSQARCASARRKMQKARFRGLFERLVDGHKQNFGAQKRTHTSNFLGSVTY